VHLDVALNGLRWPGQGSRLDLGSLPYSSQYSRPNEWWPHQGSLRRRVSAPPDYSPNLPAENNGSNHKSAYSTGKKPQ